MKIALIACTKKKQAKRCKAIELYSPSTLFSASVDYARYLGVDEIVILSAKHHAVHEDTFLSPYDYTLKGQSSKVKQEWTEVVIDQLKDAYDIGKDEFVILAGNEYTKYLLPHLHKYSEPVKGMPLGIRVQHMRAAISNK